MKSIILFAVVASLEAVRRYIAIKNTLKQIELCGINIESML